MSAEGKQLVMDTEEYLAMLKNTKRNKFNARKVWLDGYIFDSEAESRRYLILRDEQATGLITGLEIHPMYTLQPAFRDNHGKKQKAITYKPDFRYTRDGRAVVEDVKGGKATVTAEFRIKARLLMFQHPEIRFEVVAA